MTFYCQAPVLQNMLESQWTLSMLKNRITTLFPSIVFFDIGDDLIDDFTPELAHL